MQPSQPQHKLLLKHLFFCSYIALALLCLSYYRTIEQPEILTALFSGALQLTYPFLYLLPAIVTTIIIRWLLERFATGTISERAITVIVYTVALMLIIATFLFIFADQAIYRLYGFHVNGFVLNLITTPGGAASMGGGRSTYITFGLLTALTIAVPVSIWWLLRLADNKWGLPAGRSYKWLLLAFFALTVSERIAHGISSLQGYKPIMSAADAYPLYKRTTFKSAAALGYSHKRNPLFLDDILTIDDSKLRLSYPLQPITSQANAPRYNILWLVAESWRADMLNPEIMPATWEFATKSTRFANHYSTGNGTRMGIFGMFYGLYGSYWFPMLRAERGPVLIDTLQDFGYNMQMYTSANFSYPE